MQATGTFTVTSFLPATVDPPPAEVATALPVGVATMEKRFDGDVTGRSSTVFTSAFDQERGVGSYVAMESFEGSLNGVAGTFNFAHSATTHGRDRAAEHFVIVPSSGTGGLAGISGTGRITMEDDGRHHIQLDYELT
jgi:hypothetical protein